MASGAFLGEAIRILILIVAPHTTSAGVVPSGRNLFLAALFQVMDAFTLLSFIVTFLVGATAGAWVNSLTNSYVLRSLGRSSAADGHGDLNHGPGL